MTLDQATLPLLARALARLDAGFEGLPPFEPADPDAIGRILDQVADRLHDNFPYFHPLYAGQMIKPPHPVARLAYALTLWINPNNHALDGGRASSAMEREAVAAIARLVGWDPYLGHLTGGGTMANLEALWVAGRLHPGRGIAASSQAHYTHERISAVLGLPFVSVPPNRHGQMDLTGLRQALETGAVGTVVATLGTPTGRVDPLAEILELAARRGVRVHADAAYGGYFGLVDNLAPDTARAFAALPRVDSVVIDPHKHGLQPYGCGSVLFRDPGVGRFYRHDSPYTYFSSTELHLGEISLECSRPGAAAVALWATQQLLPLERGGQFAGMLAQGREAALELARRIREDHRFLTLGEPELDIVVWAVRAPTVSAASDLAQRVFEAAAERGLHLALAELPVEFLDPAADDVVRDRPTITCLRSVLMKPEHLEWLPRIWALLDLAVNSVLPGSTETATRGTPR